MTLLRANGVTARYGDFQALFGVDLTVDRGELVAVIGANGAGKSTLLKCLVGMLSNAPEDVVFAGEPIGALPPHAIVRRGIALVPEGRRLFPSLTVEENLLMGASSKRRGPWSVEGVYRLFPVLRERRQAPATDLSGGQQQMVAIGRGLMSNPDLLLCDEISLGLAPVVIKEIYADLVRVATEDTAIIVVEQDIGQALKVANRVYCLQAGRVSLEGEPARLSRAEISSAYFGV